MKLNEPLTPEERLSCLKYIRSEWWGGPIRRGEERPGQKAPDAQNPEAFHCLRLMYLIANEYEQFARQQGLLPTQTVEER